MNNNLNEIIETKETFNILHELDELYLLKILKACFLMKNYNSVEKFVLRITGIYGRIFT